MERYSQIAAVTNAVGSLLSDLVDNALKPPGLAALASMQTLPIADRSPELNHAAICRIDGSKPGMFGIALSESTANSLTSLVIGDIADVTPMHVANVVSETSQWIASRTLPALGVMDFSFAPENVGADKLTEWFTAESDSVWILFRCELGEFHVGMRLES